MNTTNILLGMTCILLVVGFALSFGDLTQSRSSDASKEEVAELRSELERIDAEDRAFELSRLRAISTPYVEPAPIIEPSLEPVAEADPAPISPDMEAIIKSQQEKIDALENENADLADENTTLETENEEIFEEKKENQDEQRMAAFRIKNALTMGTVTSASKANALVIFTPSASASFQPGRILAVRRNTGIIGKIEIDRLADSGEYVATMRPHGYSPDGYPDIQPGDTIIIDLEG
jgi:hypothetical protein